MEDKSNLRISKCVFWIGLIDCVFCFISAIIFAALQIWDGLIYTGVVYVIFIPIGIWLMLYARNWKITLNDDGFTFCNICGKAKTYKYEEVTALKRKKLANKIYIGKKVITIDILFTKGNYLYLWDKLITMNIPIK